MGATVRETIQWDRAAEESVLGAVLLHNEAFARAHLDPADFFDPRHRTLWEAMASLVRQAKPIDPIMLEGELNGRFEACGGFALLSDLIGSVGTADNIEFYADRVRAARLTRDVQIAASEIMRSGLEGEQLRDYLVDRMGQLDRDSHRTGDGKDSRITWISTSDIFAPLPATPWLSKELGLCPGRPALMAAYGYSGKTLISQSAALAMTTTMDIWGHFPPPPRAIKVRHFDFEQGAHATKKRYQRLALGMGIDPRDIGDRLELCVFPDVYLNSADAIDVYARETDGCEMAILDALRGATPGEDENDSKMRACIDMLSRISEKNGCLFHLLHHAGKTKDNHKDLRMILRGSSGIYDACGSVLVLTGENGEPRDVTQVKAPAEAEGTSMRPFQLEIVDLADGVVVRFIDRSASDQPGARQNPAGAKSKDELIRVSLMQEDIIAAIRLCKVPPTSRSQVCDLVSGEYRIRQVALTRLVSEGNRLRKVDGVFMCS